VTEHRVQRRGYLVRVPEAVARILAQELQQHRVERRGRVRHQVVELWNWVLDVLFGDGFAGAEKRGAARHELEEQTAERVEIAARVDQLSTNLFR